MRHLFAIAIALSLLTFSFNAAFAQRDKTNDKQPPTKETKDKTGRQTGGTKQGDKKPPTDHRNNGQRQNPPTDHRDNGQRQNPPTDHRNNAQPQNRQPTDRQPDRTTHNQQSRQPRSGQIVIQPNRDWRPDRDHRYHSSTYLAINIWTSSTFGYGGRTYNWDPSVWRYWVDNSLMEIVYRSERMSNSLRDSFERQMTRGNLRSSRGGQSAWDRVQRMDESLEKLRSEIGYVSQNALREDAVETLELAQLVARSFNRNPSLLQLVPYAWDDLRFELNELARYYDEPTIN